MKENYILDKISTATNRNLNQTKFLFELVGSDFDKLIELEIKIKNTFTGFCPSTTDEVETILKLKNKTNYFNIDLFPEGTIQFKVENNNNNCLILKQKQNGKLITVWKVIPPGINKTDIISTTKILEDHYTVDIDSVIIFTDDIIRKVFHLNRLQLEYVFKTGEVIYENKYEHLKKEIC